MRLSSLTSEDALLAEIGSRLAATRVERRLTQRELSDASGVALSTIRRAERGRSVDLASLLRLLRPLDLLDALDAALPAPAPSPLAQLEFGKARRTRVQHTEGTAARSAPGRACSVGRRAVTTAEVTIFGTRVGAVTLADDSAVAAFQYAPEFVERGVEIAPLAMPLRRAPYTFPELDEGAFRGLPGLLADSLPDRFGNALIDAWLARQSRLPASFDAVERLCYVGRRGMGALEFRPVLGPANTSHAIDVSALAELATEVLRSRSELEVSFDDAERERAMRDILLVGTSAGGARAKAVIAWNPETNEVRSGQLEAGSGFEYWLLKLDGVSDATRELGEPSGYGAVEFAYFLMARACGIEMMPCRLLVEGGRRHFMTQRFDRTSSGGKLHMQSLGGLCHFDFNEDGAHGYEQALQACTLLGLGADAREELLRRMLFNVVARNQDDHVKNIAFLMDRDARWSLSPAFDVTYAYNPERRWTARHQMTINGKRDDFARGDFQECAASAGLKRRRADVILDEVVETVRSWPSFADEAGVPDERCAKIAGAHRLAF